MQNHRKNLWDLCFLSNTHHPLLTPRNNVFAVSYNARGCKNVNAWQTFYCYCPLEKNDFSNTDRQPVHQKDAEIQHRICQPRTGVAGRCSMDAPVLAQPWSDQCGPCRAVYSAAPFWIQARTLHGAKKCSQVTSIQVVILGTVPRDLNKDPAHF